MSVFNNWSVDQLAADWIEAKAAEKAAMEYRRDLEDELTRVLAIDEQLEGTMNVSSGQHQIKIIGRIDRKVDPEQVQAIAAENGLEDALSQLFRWKPEIIAAAWKAAPESTTGPLLRAITSKAGRPSFTITPKGD